jgi:hypothetical protein
MTLILSWLISVAHADRLALSFHFLLTASVFAFLAVMILAG